MVNVIYQLPQADKITEALNSVNDDQYLKQYIYPTIATNLAGRELHERGIGLALELAASDAMKVRELPGPVFLVFSMQTEDYVQAIQGVSASAGE